MPRTPEAMREAIIRNLPEKTGKTVEEWVEVLRGGPQGRRKDRVEWLKREHGLGHGQASMVVDATDRPELFLPGDQDELIDSQYRGKEALRSVFDALRAKIEELGPDVEVEPRQTYVAFSRRRQFALAQPSTATRLDLGLVLPETAAEGRLQAAGSFGSGRISHRVSLSAPEEMDDQLLSWLRRAYDAAR